MTVNARFPIGTGGGMVAIVDACARLDVAAAPGCRIEPRLPEPTSMCLRHWAGPSRRRIRLGARTSRFRLAINWRNDDHSPNLPCNKMTMAEMG
jgi:hypothetical protein